jgi:hypothetical protein
MDPPRTDLRPEQLPLPFIVSPSNTAPLTQRVLAPPHVWATLPPALQAACRRTLIQILQEVLHDSQCNRQDPAAPS